MYSVKKRHKDTEKSQRDENITENYKTLKRDFWKICSLIWYTYFIVAVRVRVFADMSKETLPKRRIWVNIESLVHLTLEYLSLKSLVYLSLGLSISFINCAQEGTPLISKQRAVKKKNACLCQHQGHTNKMDSEYLENYVWIYANAGDLDQGVVLWGIWFFFSCDN